MIVLIGSDSRSAARGNGGSSRGFGHRSPRLFLSSRCGAEVRKCLGQQVQAHGRLTGRWFLMVFHKRKSHFFATKTQNRSGACFPDRSLMTGGIRCSRYPGIAGR